MSRFQQDHPISVAQKTAIRKIRKSGPPSSTTPQYFPNNNMELRTNMKYKNIVPEDQYLDECEYLECGDCHPVYKDELSHRLYYQTDPKAKIRYIYPYPLKRASTVPSNKVYADQYIAVCPKVVKKKTNISTNVTDAHITTAPSSNYGKYLQISKQQTHPITSVVSKRETINTRPVSELSQIQNNFHKNKQIQNIENQNKMYIKEMREKFLRKSALKDRKEKEMIRENQILLELNENTVDIEDKNENFDETVSSYDNDGDNHGGEKYDKYEEEHHDQEATDNSRDYEDDDNKEENEKSSYIIVEHDNSTVNKSHQQIENSEQNGSSTYKDLLESKQEIETKRNQSVDLQVNYKNENFRQESSIQGYQDSTASGLGFNPIPKQLDDSSVAEENVAITNHVSETSTVKNDDFGNLNLAKSIIINLLDEQLEKLKRNKSKSRISDTSCERITLKQSDVSNLTVKTSRNINSESGIFTKKFKGLRKECLQKMASLIDQMKAIDIMSEQMTDKICE